MDEPHPLSDLERELLECASMAGETTTTLDEEMLEDSPEREVVEATLHDLLDRGLVTTERGPHLDGSTGEVFDDDWWDVTPAGRAAIDLPPRAPRLD